MTLTKAASAFLIFVAGILAIAALGIWLGLGPVVHSFLQA
jgi:hypothetical protein